LEAAAHDNDAIREVQFLVDGNPVLTPDRSAPYSIVWSSPDASNGNHTVSASATDKSGNSSASTGVAVAVDNFVVDSMGSANLAALEWPNVTLYFSHAVDPSSLTDATLYLTQGITPIHSGFVVAPDGKSVTLHSPILPGSNYGVVATIGVTQTSGGLPLDRAFSSAFQTSLGTAIDLGNQINTGHRVLLEATGVVHVIGAQGASLNHSDCSANCANQGSWHTNSIPNATAGIFFPSAVIDGAGGLHVLYHDGGLNYASCAGGCGQGINWSSGVIDTANQAGMSSALAVDGSGTLHMVYASWKDGHLHYGNCSASCSQSASWSFGTLPASLLDMTDVDLAIGQSGAMHVVYRGQMASTYPILYATCAASCTVTGNWQEITLESAPALPGSGSSLVMDQTGALHHAYYVGHDPLRYAVCATNCLTLANWHAADVDPAASGVQVSLAVSGERRAILYSGQSGQLRIATCADACNLTASWRSRELDPTTNSGIFPDLVFGADQQPRYTSGSAYVRYTQ
jgi:hypothetical protein